MSLKVHIRSLGCPKNDVDSKLMASYLKLAGHSLVQSPSAADVLVVNTCGFIEQAKAESIDHIFDLVREKGSGKRKRLIVAGCLAQRYRKELQAGIPEIDGFLGVGDVRRIVRMVTALDGASCFTGQLPDRYQCHDVMPNGSKCSFAYLRISDGCDNRCSYCAIPSIRGGFRSRPMADILREARHHAEQGVRELVLIGQDTTLYGADTGRRVTLTGLVEELLKSEGKYLIRLMYAHPAHLHKDLIRAMGSNKRFVPYVDLPLQHVSDKMLRLMNRKVSRKQVVELVERLRMEIPGVTIRTTYLVGHPGETSADFEKLLRFQEEYAIERVGVFGYSPEESTRSFSMSGRVRRSTADRRVDVLMSLVQEQSLARNHTMIGTCQDVIVDSSAGKGMMWARLLSQAPEVDGAVLLTGIRRRGSLVSARITAAEAYDLYASVGRV
jgi:ribosomal protein S12 methylthiotransferase